MSLTVQVAGMTDIGCVRANNEDNFGYDSRYGIYVVCDGMGGQAAGEVAAKIAVDAVLTYFRNGAKDNRFPIEGNVFQGLSAHGVLLASAIHQANQSIHQVAAENPSRTGMGSTIAAVLVHGGSYTIAHVGDSRIYQLREGAIRQLTNDHSLVMEQVRRGLITEEEARHSDMQNIIIRALGSGESVEPDVSEFEAEPGCTLLLCSDGLTRHVPDETINAIVERAPELPEACSMLVDAAKMAGGQDNITCMLLRFVEQGVMGRLFGGNASGPKWQDSM
jgi:PPM family protein phosphatase